MATKVELINLRESNRALKKLPDYARVETQQVMEASAYRVVAAATAAAPARDKEGPSHGIHLKDAIRWKRRKFGAVVGVDRRAYHWKFWEYGTKLMPAQPFFRPAAAAQRGDHQARLTAALLRAKTKMSADAPPPIGAAGASRGNL